MLVHLAAGDLEHTMCGKGKYAGGYTLDIVHTTCQECINKYLDDVLETMMESPAGLLPTRTMSPAEAEMQSYKMKEIVKKSLALYRAWEKGQLSIFPYSDEAHTARDEWEASLHWMLGEIV